MGRFLYAFRCSFGILIVALGIRVKILKSPIKKTNLTPPLSPKVTTVLKIHFFIEQAFCNESCVVDLKYRSLLR